LLPLLRFLCDAKLENGYILDGVQKRHSKGLVATIALFNFDYMIHISILIPKGSILASLEGSRQLFAQVNQFVKMKGGAPLFKIELVGLDKETKVSGGLFTVNADALLNDVKQTNLIIIPAIDGDLSAAMETNKDFVPWIVKQYAQGAEVASLCLGAFLLASTGLLDGKKCATHWVAEGEFRRMFPQVNLVTEKIITEENGIYSSGGAFSYLNLILHLIEKYAGHDMAVLCAKVFAIEMERDSQASFIIFQGQKSHEDEQVKKAQEFIESNYTERTTVEQLAGMLAVGRRSFERRFKKATSNTVNEYIQRVKIEAAKKELESSRKSVYEVMYEVGYNDNKAFRSTFKKITGLSPLEYRNKYNKLATMVAA
jgi:transcriptional regulator GlxA family with amidase domain